MGRAIREDHLWTFVQTISSIAYPAERPIANTLLSYLYRFLACQDCDCLSQKLIAYIWNLPIDDLRRAFQFCRQMTLP